MEIELEGLKSRLGREDGVESASALGAAGDMAEALRAQTEVLKQAIGKSTQGSITTVKTDLQWPTLSDDSTDVRDVTEFYESFEDNCGLANNCRGMSKREMLVALRSRCRGPRLKTFQNIYRQEQRKGLVESDPEGVYERIKAKHLLFSESVEEREIRVDSEHAAMVKGKLTGHQFEPLFERSIAELEDIGLGKTARELFLSYIRKIGPVLQKEVRREKRIWPGENDLRPAKTWEEAHKLVLEYEQREATNRASQNSVLVSDDTPKKKSGKHGGDSVLATAGKGSGKGDKKSKICFHFRDHGNCPKGDSCEYSHDKELRRKILAERKGEQINATKESKGSGYGRGRSKSRDRSRDGRGKSPKQKGGRGRSNSPKNNNKKKGAVVCPFFLKNGSCKKGDSCDMTHALAIHAGSAGSQAASGSQGAVQQLVFQPVGSASSQPAGQLTLPAPVGMHNVGGTLTNPFGAFSVVVNDPNCSASALLSMATKPDDSRHVTFQKPEVRMYVPGTPLKPVLKKDGSVTSLSTISSGGDSSPLSTSSLRLKEGDPKKVVGLDELPASWWTTVPNASGGYQYRTVALVCQTKVEMMLDGCAGSNHGHHQ